MQTTLTFTKDGKKYVSNKFNMGIACLINDRHDRNMNAKNYDKVGIFIICNDAVEKMFDGTEATQDVLESLPVRTRTSLCNKLFDIYMEECFSKNE